MRILVYNERCTGCRACELACSFHFTRAFSRKASALEIRRFEPEGRFEISIVSRSVGGSRVCDLCEGETEPMCIKYCDTDALKMEE